MRVRNVLRLSCLAALGSVVFSPPALAQEIEEIVVTATKRAKSIQDVGIAINAFTSDNLRDLGWSDVTQVANQSPNLDIKYAWGNSMPIYTIRGVGMNSFQASDTPSVGLFVDEIFQTSIATMGTQLFDMERVEVLKGPQGALFGRNTNGGAVSYFSRRPSAENEGFVRFDVGNYNRYEVEGALNGAFSETFSARLSFSTIQQEDGWVHDRTSNTDVGEVDILAGRLQFSWRPDDDLDINLKLFSSRDRSQPAYFQHIGFWEKGAPARTLCQAWQQTGTPDPATCVDVLGYSDTDGDSFAGDYTHRLDTPINANARLDNKDVGATLSIVKDWDALQFTSLTNWQTYDRFQPKESDGNPLLFVDLTFASEIEAISQEFRLMSNNDGMFNWIAGVVYAEDNVEETPPRVIYADHFLGLRAGLTYEQDRKSSAFYIQGEWQFNDRWAMTAGARYIKEKLKFEEEVYFLFPPDFNFDNRFILTTIPNEEFEVDGRLNSNETTWKVSVDFTPNSDLLFYGSVSTGFKGGGFNAGLLTNPRLAIPFDPEEVLAYEVGMKSTLADGRVQFNTAIFTYDYQGLQAATPRVDELLGTPLNFLTNLEDASIKGMEAELQWRPTEALSFNLGLGLLDTKNRDPGVNFNGPFGNAPRVLPNSPEKTLNASVSYDLPLANGSFIRFFTDFVWEDDHYKEIVNNLEIDSQYLWNGRISWFSADDKWSLALWGKNLTNEVYVVDTLTDPIGSGWGVYVVGMPRTYGVSATYHF